jgi:hypothetical protein
MRAEITVAAEECSGLLMSADLRELVKTLRVGRDCKTMRTVETRT